MNTGNLRPPGAPTSSRRGQEDGTCAFRGPFLPSRVFPLSAASRFSPKARLFASAATAGGSSTSDQAGSSACRSRVKVWEATSGGASARTVSNSCSATAVPESDGAAGAVSRAQVEQHTRACEVEWSRQFLGHSVNAVLFAPTPQQTKQTIHTASAVHRNGPLSGEGQESSGDDDGSTVLLIGTDKGMVAAANVTGGNGSKLLYAVYLGAVPGEEERGSDGRLACLGTSNSIAGGYAFNAAITPMAAAAMGTTSLSAVYDLRALPGRSDAVVALVGCVEGSTIYLLSVEDGSVLQEDALSKSYTLMATPSHLLPPPSRASVEGAVFHTQLRQLALLGCGSARKVDRETQLDQSARSGVLFLFDVPQRKQWLKLTGASSDSCCSLALQDNLEFAAACFSSSSGQQQTQLLVWKLPSRAAPSSEKGAAAKRKKLPPAMMTHFFEGLVQLLLPVTRFKSEAEEALTSNEMVAGAAQVGSNRKHRVQVLIGLSRSSVIAVWGCLSTENADSQASSFTLELLLQVDTVTPSYSLSCGKAFSARPGLVAAAAAPGVWYIEEAVGSGWWSERTAVNNHDVHAEGNDKARETDTPRTSDDSTACQQHELILRVVRGSYAAPIFACVAIPPFSDGSLLPKDQLLYLPLLLTSSGKLSCPSDGVARPLSARELKQTMRKGSEQREDMVEEKGSRNQEDQCATGAARELPTACLKRRIGAACSGEEQTVSEASSTKKGQTKIRKAAGFSVKEKAGGAGVGKSSVASILRQALVASDARLLESVLSSTAKDKKEVAAAVASLTPARALLLLQHLVQQQQTSPATSILKGPWIEELVKQHGVVLGTTEAGREQLVLLLLQVEERRRTEAALVKVKGRVELLLQQMQRVQKLKEQRRKDELEAREPLVVHREHGRS